MKIKNLHRKFIHYLHAINYTDSNKIYYLNRSFIQIRLKNEIGYSIFSDPYDLLNKDEASENDNSTITPIDQSLLPSQPRIQVAAFDYVDKKFYLKWLVDSNGGSAIEKVEVTFLEYNSAGPNQAKKIGLFIV